MTRRLAELLLPFALVFLLLGAGARLFALLAAGWYAPYNEDLEGYRILKNRREVAEAKLPARNDILLAGTSRTMADFSASRLADGIGKRCEIGGMSAYNLGNVANSYPAFEALLDKVPLPRVLVLEFSPHVVLRQAPPELASEGLFHRYRARVKEFELLVAGRLRQALLFEDPLVLNDGVLASLIQQKRSGRVDVQQIYYSMRGAHAYGQKLQPDGQVYYRVYVPDRHAAGKLPSFNSEYDAFESIHLAGQFDTESLRSLERIVERFGAGRRIVIVRPPVSREIYALENRMQRNAIERVTAFLARRGVPYVDMNPSPYHFTDLSHVDWYDTARATESLARRLIRAMEWGRVYPESRPCAEEPA